MIEKLKSIVGASRKNIIVIGDVIVDHWIRGRIGECQEGCIKLDGWTVTTTPGGAALAAHCLVNWSVRCSLYSYPDKCYPHKYRFVDSEEKVRFRWDDERLLGIMDHTSSKWAFDEHLAISMARHADAVLLSDYDKGFLRQSVISEVVDICNNRGIPCVADCKRPPSTYDGCILKVNEDYQKRYNDELSALVYDAEERSLVVTCGPINPLVWDNGVLQKGMPFFSPVPCVNHVGAGDCFAAHLTLALAYGFSLKEASVIAHSAGRIYVQRPNACAPHPDDIVADLRKRVTDTFSML